MRGWLSAAPSRRTLLVALLCSVALHALLATSLYVAGSFGPTIVAKRGEPLFVDIAPERPEEQAPRGDPARPPGPGQAPPARRPPESVPPKAPEARPRVSEAPSPAPPKAPAPEPQQVAKVAPAPAPASPPARAPEPAPAPPPRAPERGSDRSPERPPDRADEPGARSPSAPASGAPGPALAKSKAGLDLPAAMLRRPGGGGGLGEGRGGVEGEPIPMDTADPKYRDYLLEVREKIRANWSYPHEAAERHLDGSLVIEFHIARDGRLSLLELRRTSGVAVLDDYALNAVRLAQPFPPVPEALIAKFALPIAGTFIYRIVDASSLVNQIIR